VVSDGGSNENNSNNNISSNLMNQNNPQLIAQRQQQTENLLNSLKLHEAWDILDSLKKMVCDESQSQKVRNLLENCPQLIPAIYEIEVSSIIVIMMLLL
jgi:RNA polymerase-interacting CarD/CdnL/TRCF family regulator